jgi:hypothetical protein
VVPAQFKIQNSKFKITIQNSKVEASEYLSDKHVLEPVDEQTTKFVWNDISLGKGDEMEIIYTFDAPDVSPAFYLLGPLQVGEFAEARQWQIASDALEARANTAQFIAGTWSADGNQANGRNSDTNYTFNSFNFRLGENGVTVKNAYVVFESQFEAYANNGNYTGYSLYFDSCQAPCTPNALTGTSSVTKTDTTVLAYNETNNSNQVRLIFDVTSEAQLASYGGTSTLMSAQVGYNIRKAAASVSIANAKATLHITYTYNPNTTESYTNTVIYPLESLDSARGGTKATSTADDCTLNSNCPLFGYNMNLADYSSASSSRESQWFTMYNTNDVAAAAANDITNYVNIQGSDIDSAKYVLESSVTGTKYEQAVLPAMWFPNVSGYAENTSQYLEYRATSTGAPTYYLQGGEVTETYIASSSFATKTRTVAFPIGVIVDNPAGAGTSTATTTVYFPENGAGTGIVSVKKAWVRLITSNNTSAANNTRISTMVGATPLSASVNYAYNPNVTGYIAKTSFNIIHIINSSYYSELEKANATNGINVGVSNYRSTTGQRGVSAVLMITYTYTTEKNGYLSSLSLYGGQSAVNPGGAGNLGQSTTTPTANSVLPETLGTKTIRAAGINASYLSQDFDSSVGTTTSFDTNLSTGAPVCSNVYRADGASINNFTEYYKNITSAMNTTNNQSYNACYTNSGANGDDSGGAKMNGILFYTYSWDNKAPTSTITSAAQTVNGSRLANITFQTWDQDQQDLRAKIEYDVGADCDFAATSTPTISTVNASTTASVGDPQIDNNSAYQIGTASGYILTTSGSNNVNTVWEAGANLNNVEGTYCLKLTANDMYIDQATSATSTIYIDTKNPSNPGALSLNSRTGTKLILNYGATTTETNFKEYKIYYKVYDGSPVYDTDAGVSVVSSSTDENLGDKYFKDIATTSISGLTAMQTYSIRIYAYDSYGNKASSSQVNLMTNDAPIGFFNNAPLTLQKTDGSGEVIVSMEADDPNNSNTVRAKIEYVAGADCNFASPEIPSLDAGSIQSEYGSAWIDSSQIYQIGTSTPADHWIWTAPGQNTISFDWLTKGALPAANGDYCLRLTVNDLYDDQLILATTSVLVDNVNPVAGTSLGDGGKTQGSITLAFGLPATDDHFSHYKIFYKEGISGVTEANTPHPDDDLDDQFFNTTATTTVSGLNSDTDYVFNIWAYDQAGNKAAATEISIRTNSSLTNQSLTFVNPVSSNIAVANGTSTFVFRAVVNEATGWENIASATLRLADSSDSSAPFSDLVFKWDQNTDVFSETGADALNAVTLSNTSSSTCAGITCTLDFRLIFNHLFQSSSVNYAAELYSANDPGYNDLDTYADIYQVGVIKVKQIHYRWRFDNGKE